MKRLPCKFCEHFRTYSDDLTLKTVDLCLEGKPKILKHQERSCRKFVMLLKFVLLFEGGEF